MLTIIIVKTFDPMMIDSDSILDFMNFDPFLRLAKENIFNNDNDSLPLICFWQSIKQSTTVASLSFPLAMVSITGTVLIGRL